MQTKLLLFLLWMQIIKLVIRLTGGAT